MIIAFAIVHVLVCLFLIGVVLLQSGKAADLAGAFGGMGSQTAFGPRGTATLLSKWTTVAAGLFMLTSLCLAVLETRSKGTQSSVIDSVQPKTPPAGAPATPGSIGVGTSGGGTAPKEMTIPIPMPPTGGPAPVGAPAGTQQQQQPQTPAPAPAAPAKK